MPNGNLVANGADTLYGVATYGGSKSSTCETETFGQNGCGVLYKLVKTGSDWAWGGTIYKFPGGAHGAGPSGELLSYKGKIYGMTAEGGATACGNGGCGTIGCECLNNDVCTQAPALYAAQNLAQMRSSGCRPGAARYQIVNGHQRVMPTRAANGAKIWRRFRHALQRRSEKSIVAIVSSVQSTRSSI